MKVRIGVGVMILALAGVDLATAQVQPPQDRINTALARARQVGIPVALLESKIAEGKAKGVSLDRIAEAVERRQAALEKASQALRGQPDAASSLSVGADAVEAGVSDAALKAIADNAPRDRRNVAIAGTDGTRGAGACVGDRARTRDGGAQARSRCVSQSAGAGGCGPRRWCRRGEWAWRTRRRRGAGSTSWRACTGHSAAGRTARWSTDQHWSPDDARSGRALM